MNKMHLCEMKAVESSNIKRVGYIKECMMLFIEFGSTVYEYYPVHNDLYTEMMKAESKGSFFAQWIKSDPSIHCIKLPS